MAATSFDPRNPKIICRYGIAEITSESVEGASQSFKAGALVELDSSGAITAASDALASAGLYGIVQKDATAASTVMPVQVIGADDQLDMYITDGSGSAQAHTNLIPGIAYDLVVTSGIYSVNAADTTGGALVFVSGIDDAAGAATSRGRFRLLLANNQNLI